MKKLVYVLPLVAVLTMGLTGCNDSTTEAPVARPPIADAGLTVVDSSAFSQVGYNADAQELTLVFRDTGSVYVYSGISPDVGQAFMTAESMGGYYHANIRDQYESSQQP